MPTNKKPTATEIADAFLAFCEKNALAVRLKATKGVVAVEALFAPGNTTGYILIEGWANAALDMLGAKGGSRWGSTSDSVGGASALNSGRFALNQSGAPLRVIAALRKTGKCIEG